ncbi:beta-alanine transporter-like [Dermacentor andersoni]|uniref:beta-alanine transporter-like n=1 Tax=Dermacentor andersoni TaxID=34620 RepID=UPI003B3BD105
MDSLVDEACGYGRYQRVLLWLVLYPAQVSCGPQLYGQLLMFLEPDHWCRGSPPPEHWANGTERLQLCASLPSASTACPDGYEYDRRFLGDDETAVTQWDLVCNRRILATLSMFLFGTGLLAGHFLSVLVSHRWGQRACFTTFLFVQCLWGQRACFTTFLFVQCLFGMLAALSSKFLVFLLFRTLVAVGTAGTWTSLSILVGDLAGRRHRAGALVCSRLAHGLGLLLLGLVSLAVRGWGHLAAATSVPFVAFLVYWRIIPNSPKWLLARGKLDRVEQLLVAIAHTNGKQVDFLYCEKLRASLTRLSGREGSGIAAILHFPAQLPRVQSARRRRVVVVLIVGLLTGAVSLAQVYLAASLAGNSYLHLLLMSCAELSACVAPLALLERAGCGLVVFCGCLAGGAACLAHLALAGRPCLSLCLLAVAKASVGSSLAVLPAWLLEGAPCPGHQHLAHLAQAAELAAFPVVPLLFPADSPETTLVVLSALLAFSCALSVLACDTRRVRGLWCLWRPDAPWAAWSWEKSRDMKCRSIAWEFKYPQVPSPIPSLVKRQEERKHDGRCSGHLRLAEVVRVTVV